MPSTRLPRRRARLGGIVAALALVVATCSSAAQTTPTPTAGPTPRPLPIVDAMELSAGTYVLQDFPVALVFDVPEGWLACAESAVEQGVCYRPDENSPPVGIAFLDVINVVADPCSETPLEPAVGPTVDDLVAAISGLDGFEATAPTDVSGDGFSGKEITVTAPAAPSCDLKTWATANRTNGVGAGEINVMRILDVDGTRVVVSAAYHPGDPAAAERLAALLEVMDSVRVES